MRLVPLLTFLGGTIIGVSATLWLLPTVDPIAPVFQPARAHDQSVDELKQMRGLLDEKEASLAEMAAELINLQQVLDEARKAQAEAEAQLSMRLPQNQTSLEEQRDALRAEAMERGMRRFADKRTDELQRRLHLSDDQLEAVRAYFQSRSEQRIAEAEARRNGEEPPVWTGLSTRDALAAILDPDQLTAYLEYDEAVQTSRAETRATAQMNAFAPELGLTDEQKDAVFSIYYLDTENQSDEETGTLSGEQRFEQLKASMQGVLSDEQYNLWLQIENDRDRRGAGRPGPRF